MIGPILSGAAYVKFSANMVIAFHGNSLIYGQSGATVPTGAMPYQVQRLAPVNNFVTCQNFGVNGQAWPSMFTAGTGASIDSLYDPSKTNILVSWEGHNDMIGLGKTSAQAIADATTYTSQRLAVNPGWKIIHMTLLPTYYQSWSDATAAAKNALFEEYNALLRAQWRSMGAKALIDVRATGSIFNLPDYNRTTFAALQSSGQSVWSPNDQEGGGGTGQNQFVHLSDTGYSVVAQMVANVLRRVPRR